jgi:hypothetical protein
VQQKINCCLWGLTEKQISRIGSIRQSFKSIDYILFTEAGYVTEVNINRRGMYVEEGSTAYKNHFELNQVWVEAQVVFQ